MNRIKRICSIFLLFGIIVLFPKTLFAHTYYKVPFGSYFSYFSLEDIYNQQWISSYLRGKPIIILTAHRYQREELRKWAEAFRQDYLLTGRAYVLWIVNLKKCSWNTSRATVFNQWRLFNPPVPCLLDWDGVVGNSLRINYNVPNIILIDAYGRFVMHEMHTFTPSVYKAISQRISPFCPSMYLRKGRRGDSL